MSEALSARETAKPLAYLILAGSIALSACAPPEGWPQGNIVIEGEIVDVYKTPVESRLVLGGYTEGGFEHTIVINADTCSDNVPQELCTGSIVLHPPEVMWNRLEEGEQVIVNINRDPYMDYQSINPVG